ncbi:MAG: IS1182 family transposase [Nanoarchaeota archaeon]|nr:IS1182 family transposase [Nanoarchaeota archaeon]
MTFKPYNQTQNSLLPPNFKVFLGQSHRAVILSEFIDELNTTELVKSYNNQSGGSSAYHPVMLLKVLIYSYSNATFSSRKISKKLKEDIAFMFLSGNNTPDFRTISRFRQEKSDFIENIFSQIVYRAKEMGFVSFGTCSLDGTKIYANASKDKNYDKAQLEDKIRNLMQQAEDIDTLEDEIYGEDNEDDIDPDLKTKEGREKRRKQLKQEENRNKEALNQISNKLKTKSGHKLNPKRNTTDPDSRFMKMKKQDFANGYNVQNITENGLILINHIDNSSADQNTLVPTLKKLKSVCNSMPERLLADKGYSTSNNYSFCEDNNINAYIPIHRESIDISQYSYDKEKDTYTDKQNHIFFFKQHMKNKLGASKKGRPKKSSNNQGNHSLYKSTLYEHIDDKTGKKKYLSINIDWINHCKKQKKKLSTLYGKELYKKRSHDVEGVFGNIKKNLKFTHFNLRGFRGVKVEWNLISIAHNMQKLTKPITT